MIVNRMESFGADEISILSAEACPAGCFKWDQGNPDMCYQNTSTGSIGVCGGAQRGGGGSRGKKGGGGEASKKGGGGGSGPPKASNTAGCGCMGAGTPATGPTEAQWDEDYLTILNTPPGSGTGTPSPTPGSTYGMSIVPTSKLPTWLLVLGGVALAGGVVAAVVSVRKGA